MAIDPTNPQNIHILMNGRWDLNDAHRALHYRKSTDGGDTWGEHINVDAPSSEATGCDIIVDINGNPHVVMDCGIDEHVYYNFSADGGTTWLPTAEQVDIGATGLATHSMVDDGYSFTLRVLGTRGEALAADFVRPHDDDRLTITTSKGTTVERFGTRTSYTYQLEAFAGHVQHGTDVPLDLDDAVANMALIDDAYRAAGMEPR